MKKAKFLQTCREYDHLLEDMGFSIEVKEPYADFEDGSIAIAVI